MDDFVGWLAGDDGAEGLVRTDWRPTRLTYGVVRWQDNRARVEYAVDQEKPFVPTYFHGFQPPVGKREKIFPCNQQELCLATTWKLVEDGHTVLIYCPLRSSVGAFAKTIVDLHKKDALHSILGPNVDSLRNTLVIGEEWLGADSNLLYCLKLGVAIHHGALPTPYRREVERLLRKGVLRVTISSPTLAQGLNLTASALVFHAVQRWDAVEGKTKVIEPKEFRNVVGRAGRAFVDIEGQVLFPVFNDERKRLRDWRKLIEDAVSQQMESGLVLLVDYLLLRMKRKHPSWTASALREYVSNGANWEFDQIRGGKEAEKNLWNGRLSTLDTSILGLLDEAEISDDEIEERLDEVLKSSLWARTLRKREEAARADLKIGLVGRARVVFAETTPAQRRAYFLAGVGLSTGRFLDANSERLWTLLVKANESILVGADEDAITAVVGFAEFVFDIRPFVPNRQPGNWREVLVAWLRGDELGTVANTNGPNVLRFVEDGLMYRLAWAMEAVRVHRMAGRSDNGDVEFEEVDLRFAVAAVETGTLSVAAAVLMKAGFGSRNAAVKAVADGEGDFEDLGGLVSWVRSDLVVELGRSPDWPTRESHELWNTFIGGLGPGRAESWRKTDAEVGVEWFEPEVDRAGLPVRLSPADGSCKVCSASFDTLGEGNCSGLF